MLDDFFWDDQDGTDQAAQTEEHLLDTQERMGALLDLLPNAIPMGLIIHQPQAMLFVNREICRMFDASHDEMIGKHLLDFVTDDVREKLFSIFMKAFSGDEPVNMQEVELHTPNGRKHIVNISIGKLPWDGVGCVQVVLQDITELIEKERELERLTMMDPLTGAFNRRFFLNQSKIALEEALAFERPYSLIIFDLDLFKKVNDTYGHDGGDACLIMAVNVWLDNSRHQVGSPIRSTDSHLARIGGEEFAVTLPNTDLKSALVVAERIRSNLELASTDFNGDLIKITGSFGVTSLKSCDTIDDLFRRADQALYQAKEQGRNRVLSQ